VLIFKKIAQLEGFLTDARSLGSSIGFVPTMGALHQGHLSLIASSKKACTITVCSIFVNPTQFNDPADLERYPRTPEKDIDMLRGAGCDAVFMPDAEEIYPKLDRRNFDFGRLDKVLDGAHRPGHFNGVAQVISRLFDVVLPDKAFFGEKDYQQMLIIRELVKQLNYNVEVVACPIAREKDGLAMSSRNSLLNSEERLAAGTLPRLLREVSELKASGRSLEHIKNHVAAGLKNNPLYKPDYFSVCDAHTLEEIDSFSASRYPIALIACFVGKVRLIDNVALY
jgi:pantoate--beta-alanine ligase